MKQTITICRAETRTIEVEVHQPMSSKTIEKLANSGHGVSGIGALEFAMPVANVITDWQVVPSGAKSTGKGKGRR